MKRDMDLILQILRDLEENCKPSSKYKETNYIVDPSVYNCDPDVLREHCTLIEERKLAEFSICRGQVGFKRLTWEGHDFLDNANDATLWNAAKKTAGNCSFTVFMKVLEGLALQAALKAAGL